ncbi:MAG: hypothetical protein KAT00_01635 [Planctomycetes bacterium]|nr:hypothetical protein [Planctomycetota bacterium]
MDVNALTEVHKAAQFINDFAELPRDFCIAKYAGDIAGDIEAKFRQVSRCILAFVVHGINSNLNLNEAADLIARIYQETPSLQKEGLENFDGYYVPWDIIIDICSRAWPEPRGYSESPEELIVAIIDERDEARSSEQELVKKVARLEKKLEKMAASTTPKCPASAVAQKPKKQKRGRGSSQYLGVSYNKKSGKWTAQINRRGKHKGLGSYDDELLAAAAVQKYLGNEDEAKKLRDQLHIEWNTGKRIADMKDDVRGEEEVFWECVGCSHEFGEDYPTGVCPKCNGTSFERSRRRKGTVLTSEVEE